MRPTQAEDHHAAGPLLVARLAPPAGSTMRVRPNGVRSEGPDVPSDAAHGALPREADDEFPAEADDEFAPEGDDALQGGPYGAPRGEAHDEPPRWTGDARAVDADVSAAVGRVLDDVLAARMARARGVDPLFADDLAGRVARFTRDGGKRLRPRLTWWALRACGGGDTASVAAALRVGAALELLQTCALIHDDVMDGSALRRGQPALHSDVATQYAGTAAADRVERFGASAAVLAGDLALAWADDLVAETVLAPGIAGTVRRLWGDMRTEMVAGQYLDLHGQTTASRSLPRALRAACLKSALYSVERPLALGAALAGADDRTTEALCSAGRCVGMAFQLRDDLDDVFGDPARTGKAAGGDIREGKPTYLVALARARAEAVDDHRALAVLEHALGRADLTQAGLDEVRRVLTSTGARDTVETRIGRLVAQGLRHFDGAPLDRDAGDRLRGLLSSAASGPASAGEGRGRGAAPARGPRDHPADPGHEPKDSGHLAHPAQPNRPTPQSPLGDATEEAGR